MADAGPFPFTIEQLSGSQTTVTLEQSDAPEGTPYETAGWDEGGEMKLADEEGTYLVGRKLPLFHALQWRNLPRVVRGRLRDWKWGDDGHSDRMQEALIRVAMEFRPVEVTWGKKSFRGIMRKPKFGNEGDGSLTYELTFIVSEVSSNPQQDTAQRQATARRDAASDIAAQIRAMIADIQTKTSAIVTALRSADRTIDAALAIADAACEDVQIGASALEASTLGRGRRIVDTATRLIGQVDTAQRKVRDVQRIFADPSSLFQGISGRQFTLDQSADASLNWDDTSAATMVDLNTIQDMLRAMAAQARAQSSASNGKTYRVSQGDTPESIAADAIGNRSRVEDLGLSQEDCRPGRLIKLPVS